MVLPCVLLTSIRVAFVLLMEKHGSDRLTHIETLQNENSAAQELLTGIILGD